MSLKLMYITNQPEIAQIAESAGVDRIFVDLEYIGKSDRQGGMDTVQSRHTIDDVKKSRVQLILQIYLFEQIQFMMRQMGIVLLKMKLIK